MDEIENMSLESSQMALRERYQCYVNESLRPFENVHGIFVANLLPGFWWYLLLGPFAAFVVRQLVIGVTDKGLIIVILNRYNQMSAVKKFDDSELEKIETHTYRYGKKILIAAKNDDRLYLKAHLHRDGESGDIFLTPELLSYLEQKVFKRAKS